MWHSTLFYAFAHFAVDLGCAFAMFSACTTGPAGYLVYNFCAFAMQMPLGLLADCWGRNRLLALLGTVLVGLCCCLPSFGLAGAALLGLGNALFHLGGGLDVLNLSGERAAPLGVFVSPGAFGIYLGAIWGKAALSPLPVLGILLLALGGMLLTDRRRLVPNAPLDFPPARIAPWAALLFLVVVLRSYGGMAGSYGWKTGLWATAATAAIVLGKTAGGFLSDRLGPIRASWSLVPAAVLFLFGGTPLAVVPALFLFNMSMPITLHGLARAMPGCKGFSFGLLTFALFLGFLPTWLGVGTLPHWAVATVALVSFGLLVPGLRKLAGDAHG